MDTKKLGVWGSTGSIGTQTLEVVREFPDKFKVNVLTAGRNADLLISQAKEFKPKHVVIADEALYSTVKTELEGLNIEVHAGISALEEIAKSDDFDIMVAALVGAVGLKPTLAAIQNGKNIALANKETLVVAGELVTQLAKENQVKLLPVDSEHSAIFQCLNASSVDNAIEKVILTASGGPFLGRKRSELVSITPEQAKKHPNWTMGAKISIDSASMMNKGLEVIEAKWLFDLSIDQIDVIVHPQSIVHSLVQFEDSSLLAQLGLPDMKVPILYALSYPERWKTSFERFNFLDYPSLIFLKPDMEVFKNLKLAFQAIEYGGNMPAILNAANEIAVSAFLDKKISFLGMSDLIEDVMHLADLNHNTDLENYLESDTLSRKTAWELIGKNNY